MVGGIFCFPCAAFRCEPDWWLPTARLAGNRCELCWTPTHRGILCWNSSQRLCAQRLILMFWMAASFLCGSRSISSRPGRRPQVDDFAVVALRCRGSAAVSRDVALALKPPKSGNQVRTGAAEVRDHCAIYTVRSPGQPVSTRSGATGCITPMSRGRYPLYSHGYQTVGAECEEAAGAAAVDGGQADPGRSRTSPEPAL
jgi:hypothetical protein